MNRIIKLSLIVLLVSITGVIHAQDAKQKGFDAITKKAVQGQLEFLASDWTEGRATGTRGAYMAADYIASIFKIYGLEPGGDTEVNWPSWAERREGKGPTYSRTFFQSFDLIEYKPGEDQQLSLVDRTGSGVRTTNFAYRTDFSVRTTDVSLNLDMPVVFVGYGYTHEDSGYDDFKGIDVKGKIILRLAGVPGHKHPGSKASEKISAPEGRSRWGLVRQKNQRAEELGAAAIIEVMDPTQGGDWSANLPFRYNSGNYEGDAPRASFYTSRMKLPGKDLGGDPTVITVSERVLNELLKGSEIEIEQFEEAVAGSLKPASMALPGKNIQVRTSVESKRIKVRNVVGVLPGKDTSEIIVIGGHYDHLGKHDGWVWNGADDNASGTVGVMTIAKACMATGEKPEKTIVFCAWTGEEKGLLGSRYFADHPYNDARMLLNLNYDMISRDNTDDTLGIKCGMTYTKSYPVLEELATRNNQEYELGLEIRFRPSPKPRGGSDHTAFSEKDVPIFYFMAGFPPEYHQPGDHISLVNWDKMVNIIRIGYLNIWDLANTEWGPSDNP